MAASTQNTIPFTPQSKNVNNSKQQFIISRDSSSSIINSSGKHQHHQYNQIHHSNMENLNSNSNTYLPMNRLQSCHSHISQQINSNYHHVGIGGCDGGGVQLPNQMVNNMDKNDPHRMQHHTATVHGKLLFITICDVLSRYINKNIQHHIYRIFVLYCTNLISLYILI